MRSDDEMAEFQRFRAIILNRPTMGLDGHGHGGRKFDYRHLVDKLLPFQTVARRPVMSFDLLNFRHEVLTGPL